MLRDRLRHLRRARRHRVIDAPIDHVAIVVADLEATLALYTQDARLQARSIARSSPTKASRRSACAAGDSVIELLRPLDEDSPIARFRGDAATKLHHTAYRVADIAAELARLKAAGVRLIDEHAAPRRARQPDRLPASEVDRRRPDRTLPALISGTSAGAAERSSGRRSRRPRSTSSSSRSSSTRWRT